VPLFSTTKEKRAGVTNHVLQSTARKSRGEPTLTDRDTLTQELTALMKAHNAWTIRVERLRREAQALGAGPAQPEPEALLAAVTDLEEQLRSAQAELEGARTLAAGWEQKARSLSQVLYKERSERSRRIRELEQELMQLRQGEI